MLTVYGHEKKKKIRDCKTQNVCLVRGSGSRVRRVHCMAEKMSFLMKRTEQGLRKEKKTMSLTVLFIQRPKRIIVHS